MSYLITLLTERNYNTIILPSYHAKKSKILNQILFNKELLMIKLEHSVRMEVLQEHGYIVCLENMNDNSPMTNLGKLCG